MCVVVFFTCLPLIPSFFEAKKKAYNRIANVFLNKKGIDMSLSQYDGYQGWNLQHACKNIGSAMVECLTGDRGAAGSSLTGVTALCP